MSAVAGIRPRLIVRTDMPIMKKVLYGSIETLDPEDGGAYAKCVPNPRCGRLL